VSQARQRLASAPAIEENRQTEGRVVCDVAARLGPLAVRILPCPPLHAILGAMAYEITATRKRPHSFNELAGQDFVSATLRASIATKRIAHAYLFAGPRGCGKTSTARILARSLNCEQGPTADPCGICHSCQAIGRGAAIDVIEIDGASNTSVENVRQIKDEVLFPPNSSKYKIYIIDEVHMLSNSAFNALLKTIEEPPPYIVFIFATTELHKVPATIKSRCQQFNFRLIPLETIMECLRSASADLSLQADDDALLWIAREATGSLRDAYTLFDQIAAFSEGHITAAKIRDKLGLVGSERLGSLFSLCVSGNRAGALTLLDEIISGGVSLEQFVSDALGYSRGLLLLVCGIERESLLGMPRAVFPHDIVAALEPPQIERIMVSLFELYRNMRYSANPRFELELVVSRLCAIKFYVSPAQVGKTIAGLKTMIVEGTGEGLAAAAGLLTEQKKNDAEAAPGLIQDQAQVSTATTHAPETQNTTIRGDRIDQPLAPLPAVENAAAPEAGSDAGRSAAAGQDAQWLKDKLVQLLAKKRLVLSSSLERTSGWLFVADRLEICCANSYDGNMILGESNLIAKKAAELSGKAVRLDIKVPEQIVQASSAQSDSDADDDDYEDDFDNDEPKTVSGTPDAATIVERVFRGKRIAEV